MDFYLPKRVINENIPVITVEVDLRHLKADDIDKLVKEIRKAVKDVMEGRSLTRTQFASALHCVQKVCVVGDISSHTLFNVFIRENCHKHLEKLVDSPDLLSEYMRLWDEYLERGKALRKLLRYMDDNYGASDERNKNITCIPMTYNDPNPDPIGNTHQLMLKNWADILGTKKSAFAKNIIHFIESNDEEEILKQIKQVEEVSKTFDEIESFKSFSLYKRLIEEPVLEKVSEHLEKASSQRLISSSFPDYLKICNNAVTFVEQHIRKKLPRSAQSFTDAIWKKMVFDHMDTFVDRTIECIETKDLETIQRTYSFLKADREAMGKVLRRIEALEECIFFKLLETCEPSKFCETFINVYSEEFGFLKTTFRPNSESYGELEGFGKVEGPKPRGYAKISELPEMLLNYCDQFMRTKTKDLVESQLETMIDNIVVMFKYLDEKYTFVKLYAKQMATRLIHLLCQSVKAEQMMVDKLENRFGNKCVSELRTMITDVEKSGEVASSMQGEIGDHLQIPFRLLLIRTLRWPVRASKTKLLVPRELAGGMEFINRFVPNECKGKAIRWQYEYSTCEILLNYLGRTYTLQTSMCVTAIMVTFNTLESVTFQEMMTLTGIDEKDMFQYMGMLTSYKILTNDETKVTKNSKFRLNYKYENKKRHVKLIPVFTDPVEEQAAIKAQVVTDYKFYLQALVVRIMKAKKTMVHRELVNEVVRSSRPGFASNHDLIQNVIKDLVQKTYLELAPDASETYNYVP